MSQVRILLKEDESGSDLRTVRGEGVIEFPLAAVIGVLTDINARPQWDKLLQNGKIVETIDADKHIYVLYLEFKGAMQPMKLDFIPA